MAHSWPVSSTSCFELLFFNLTCLQANGQVRRVVSNSTRKPNNGKIRVIWKVIGKVISGKLVGGNRKSWWTNSEWKVETWRVLEEEFSLEAHERWKTGDSLVWKCFKLIFEPFDFSTCLLKKPKIIFQRCLPTFSNIVGNEPARRNWMPLRLTFAFGEHHWVRSFQISSGSSAASLEVHFHRLDIKLIEVMKSKQRQVINCRREKAFATTSEA